MSDTDTNIKKAWTPGPWIVAPGIDNKQVLVIGSPQVVPGPLADVRLPQHNLGFPQLREEEREANAKLIAAAPELVEALREAAYSLEWLVIHDGKLEHQSRLAAAKAALQKAGAL